MPIGEYVSPFVLCLNFSGLEGWDFRCGVILSLQPPCIFPAITFYTKIHLTISSKAYFAANLIISGVRFEGTGANMAVKRIPT
jgi:hypothetical protein